MLAYLREQVVAWPGLRAIGLVAAQRHFPAGSCTQDARYDLLSAPLSAQQCGDAVRSHWGIENQVQWLLAVACREERRRVRVGAAAETFAVLRRLALHLLRQETTVACGIQGKRLKAGWSTDYLLKVLAG